MAELSSHVRTCLYNTLVPHHHLSGKLLELPLKQNSTQLTGCMGDMYYSGRVTFRICSQLFFIFIQHVPKPGKSLLAPLSSGYFDISSIKML